MNKPVIIFLVLFLLGSSIAEGQRWKRRGKGFKGKDGKDGEKGWKGKDGKDGEKGWKGKDADGKETQGTAPIWLEAVADRPRPGFLMGLHHITYFIGSMYSDAQFNFLWHQSTGFNG